jgi:hypothetical protein
MPHRRKNKHKSRHRTHAVKPASLVPVRLPPLPQSTSQAVPEKLIKEIPDEVPVS